MVIEKVDFVDVQETSIGTRQQPGFKRLHSIDQRAFDIERSANAIFGSAQRKIDDPNLRSNRNQTLIARQSSRTLEAQLLSTIGIAAVYAVLYTLQRRQEIGERANGSRFT